MPAAPAHVRADFVEHRRREQPLLVLGGQLVHRFEPGEELRREIEGLGKENGPEEEDAKEGPREGESMHEFVERRMREVSESEPDEPA